MRILLTLASLVCIPAFAGPPSGAHPRFLVGGVKASLMANQTRPEIASLIASCDKNAGKTIASGYQGFDWADQMSSCALAWHATGSAARGMQAVTYWKALLDDQATVGDGKGGATGYMGKPMVSQDDGYSMRTYGLYSALGLDWLHDAPGVDDTLRKHAIALLKTDTDWYAASGYLNDDPGNNYFAGYFIALWAAAIAVGTDDATIGPALWAKADSLTQTLVAPHMTGILVGGDWQEGWEYGELAGANFLIAETAAIENGYSAFTAHYSSDLVLFHIYGLRPDGSFYDAGDQQDHPTVPGNASIWGSILAQPSGQVADYGRQYLSLISNPGSVIRWAQAIAEAKSPTWTKRDWTLDNLPLSYFAKGGGTFMARTGWSATDSWTSFHVSARDGANSHQHADAGHFELIRGSDELAIATADYGTFATWNHNTLLFDDQGRHSVYPPNQGAWGSLAKEVLQHVADVGVAACAQGDFGDAYLSNHDSNSVQLARRDFVFMRPDTLVIQDRFAVDQSSVKSRFAMHTSVSPTVAGTALDVDIGGSHLSSATLLPATATRTTVHEPVANTGSAPWLNNDTYAPAFRAEEEITGVTQGAFLHVLSATAKGTKPAAATVTQTGDVRVVQIDAARTVVLSGAPSGADLPLPVQYAVPTPAHADHVVFGIPGAAFVVTATAAGASCNIVVAAGSDTHSVSGDGTVAFHLDGCAIGAAPAVPDGGVDIPDAGVAVVDAGAGNDAGGTPIDIGDGDAKGGCACNMTHGDHAPWWILPLVAVAWLIRRRRSTMKDAPVTVSAKRRLPMKFLMLILTLAGCGGLSATDVCKHGCAKTVSCTGGTTQDIDSCQTTCNTTPIDVAGCSNGNDILSCVDQCFSQDNCNDYGKCASGCPKCVTSGGQDLSTPNHSDGSTTFGDMGSAVCAALCPKLVACQIAPSEADCESGNLCKSFEQTNACDQACAIHTCANQDCNGFTSCFQTCSSNCRPTPP